MATSKKPRTAHFDDRDTDNPFDDLDFEPSETGDSEETTLKLTEAKDKDKVEDGKTKTENYAETNFDEDDVEKTEESKPGKTKRRTKAEIEADEQDRADADQLLSLARSIKETGGSVEIQGVVLRSATELTSVEPQSDKIEVRHLPVNAARGHITGEIKLQNGQPVVNISKKFWVGEPPLTLSITQLDDLLTVLHALRDDVQKEA